MEYESGKNIRKRLLEESSTNEDSTNEILINNSGLTDSAMTKRKTAVKARKLTLENKAIIQSSKKIMDKLNSFPVNNKGQDHQNKNNDSLETKDYTKDRGPFHIFVKQIKSDSTNKPKSSLDLARSLFILGIKFQEILPVSRFCWRIIFSSNLEANKALKNKYLKDKQLEAFIPGFLTRRKGVIQGVPMDSSLDEFKEQIIKENNLEISNIFRLKRRNRQTGSWEDSTTVCVEFCGSILPETIKIWGVRVPILPYIPSVRICFKCGRIGHIGKTCEKDPTCLNCSEAHNVTKEQRCMAEKKCINCGGNHSTLDRTCPKYMRHAAILRLMALDNISFSEARRIIDNQSKSNFTKAPLQNSALMKTPGQYPYLPTPANIQDPDKKIKESYATKTSSSTKKIHPQVIKSIKLYNDTSKLVTLIFDTLQNSLPDFLGKEESLNNIRAKFSSLPSSSSQEESI